MYDVCMTSHPPAGGGGESSARHTRAGYRAAGSGVSGHDEVLC